jgi:hypothetical protein
MAELLTSPLAPSAASPDRQPIFCDAQLHKLIEALCADVRPHRKARVSLERTEDWLRYRLRVVETWDVTLAERTGTLLPLSNVPAANIAATIIFDQETGLHLPDRAHITQCDDAGDRLAEAPELRREVLE